MACFSHFETAPASESGAVGGSSMRVSAAGNMPLQGLVKPPAKPVVMIARQKRSAVRKQSAK